MGYEHYKVDIWLKELSKRRKIWDYIKYNPYVIYINTSAGYADIEIEFVVENNDKLIDILEQTSLKFPNAFRRYLYFKGKKIYKYRSLPELTAADFKKT